MRILAFVQLVSTPWRRVTRGGITRPSAIPKRDGVMDLRSRRPIGLPRHRDSFGPTRFLSRKTTSFHPVDAKNAVYEVHNSVQIVNAGVTESAQGDVDGANQPLFETRPAGVLIVTADLRSST